MKRLTLLRHAKSGDDGTISRDLDRRLNAKGRRAAQAIGRRLKDDGFAFDAAIASTAVRVAETIEEVATGYGRAITPRRDRRIYLASVPELIEVIQETPTDCEALLLVGHNPGLEELVLALVPEGMGDDRATVAEKYPTASVADIALDIADWSALAPGTGRLVRFLRPRDIDPALGPDAP